MKTNKIDLHEVARQTSDNPSNLVTRPTGKAVRRELADRLEQESGEMAFVLSFSDIDIIDYSCADELFAKTAGRMRQGEYPEKYLLLDDMQESHMENVGVALERKKLCLIARKTRQDAWEEVGKLDRYLKDVLELIKERGTLTARELSEELDLEHNTASTRLGNLYNFRMVVRDHGPIEEGGRMYIYRTLPSALDL